MKKAALFFLLNLTLSFSHGQSIDSLRKSIHTFLNDKDATVGISIKGQESGDTLSINGDARLPMQSVFKFHLALAVLNKVDLKEFSLKDSLLITKEMIDEYNHLWSPIRKKYPNGARLSLGEIIQYTVAWSDNLGCDLLFELIGGTEVLQAYLKSIGISDIAIVHNELEMQSDWKRQYDNWTTANAANQMLEPFHKNSEKLLSKESHGFLLETLKSTQTGKKSLRGLVPPETVLAHKTGHSGKNKEGLTGAVNDIGIMYLPNKTYVYVSVLVSNSTESDEINQMIIAEIAKLTWDYFRQK